MRCRAAASFKGLALPFCRSDSPSSSLTRSCRLCIYVCILCVMHICMIRVHTRKHARPHSTCVYPRSPWTTLAYKLPNFLANREEESTTDGKERAGFKGIGKGRVDKTRRAGKRKRHLLCRSNILRVCRNTSSEFPF